jgi:hypothetical protein
VCCPLPPYLSKTPFGSLVERRHGDVRNAARGFPRHD